MDSEKDLGGTLVLTNCSKRKRKEPGKARYVYAGPIKHLFVLAERLGASCYILSARYGLVSCDKRIEPYDLYIGDLSKSERDELVEKISKECWRIEGPWKLAVINLSKPYSMLLKCKIKAEYALIIGPFDEVESKVVLHIRPKTLGERASLLKALGGAKSVEDVLRFIEERIRR